jgi:hypothetical protein
MSFEKLWWGLCGVATTMAARKIASRALHDQDGEPKLSKTTRRKSGLGLMFVLAAASGVLLAFGDVLKEHRKQIVDVGL